MRDCDEEDPSEAPTLDLSVLGALHHLRKLHLQGLINGGGDDGRNFKLRLVGGRGCGGSSTGGTNTDGGGASGRSSRNLPPRLEELLLSQTFELNGPSVHALAGLRHLTHLSAALNADVCSALDPCTPAPLAVTLRHIQLWLAGWRNPASTLPLVAGLLAAEPPAALRLDVNMGRDTTALHLLAIREVAERVREVASLSIRSCGVNQLQVCAAPEVGPGPCT